jgi:hypothetical protein
MGLGEIAGMFTVMLCGSLIAAKFKTREKAAARFSSLKLDWVSGIGLVVVCYLIMFLAIMHYVPSQYARNPFKFW